MRILTTTLCYPTPQHPDQGIFVQRRTAALATLPGMSLRVIAPQLWCPLLRTGCATAVSAVAPLVEYPRMFSIPVLGWATDGLSYARTLSRAIEHEIAAGRRPDLIDAHFEYPDGVGAWLAGRRHGIPVCVTIRGKIVSLSKRTLRRMQITAMLRGVQARIAVSASLAAWVHRLAGSDVPVEIIPNGIDTSVYHPAARAESRAGLGWAPDAKYVLAVGHFQRLKGFDRLLAVAASIRARLGDVRFVLVGSRRGESSFQTELARLAAACNANDPAAVTFLDPVAADRLNLMYNAADLLVSASRSEGWCNAIAEVLAAGTPVVATDVGGNREQIRSMQLGTLVPDGDLRALEDAIVAALQTPYDRDAISAAGSARTWTQVAAEVQTVFGRMLAQAGESRGTAKAAHRGEPVPAVLCGSREGAWS